MPVQISKLWTDREKLKIIVVLTDMIRDDIQTGRYGVPGRPNIQSVHELIIAEPEALEAIRESIEAIINAHPYAAEDWDKF